MTKRHFLDFEQPVAELEAKIEELRYVQNESAVDISEEIDRLSKKSLLLTKDIYSGLTPWQVTQIARHPQRPYTLDYLGEIFTDFQELHGDRAFADDQSIVGGLARFNGQACVVFGHQKGRDTKSKIRRNFGMPRPEGYRKALRLMQMAERFERVIAALRPRTREAFLLYRFDACSHVQIAQRMGVSVSMVEKHVSSAMAALQAARTDVVPRGDASRV